MEILRALGQLVDSQKDLLEAVRASNNHPSNNHSSNYYTNQPDAAPPRITTPSLAGHHGRPTHPRAEEATTWTSPGYNESVLEPSRSGPDPISCQRSNNSHSPGTPLVQRQEPGPDSAETSPRAFTIAGSPVALRSFGLLVNDARREVTPTAECEAQPNSDLIDDHDGAFAGGTPLQRATRIVDGSPDTVGSSNYRISSVDDIGLPTRLSERQLWQDKDVIQLLPSETVLFENFVQHISFWVILRFSCSKQLSLRRTDIAVTFPSDRLIYLIQDATSLQ